MTTTSTLAGFTKPVRVLTNARRLAVVSCFECGCALLLNPQDPIAVIDRHRLFHEQQRADR